MRRRIPPSARQRCVALSRMVSKMGCKSCGEFAMARSSSEMVACCSMSSVTRSRGSETVLSPWLLLFMRSTNLGVRSSNLFGGAKNPINFESYWSSESQPCRLKHSALHLHGCLQVPVIRRAPPVLKQNRPFCFSRGTDAASSSSSSAASSAAAAVVAVAV
jgi:hypothetical protein